MTRTTLATLITINTYGTWLRGDARGWVDNGIIFPPDPILEESDRERLKHPPFYFDKPTRHQVGQAIGDSLTSRLNITILALCIQSWHAHIVIAATAHDIATIVKCAKDAARWSLRPDRPIWSTGYDKRFCFDDKSVMNRIDYVERHNLRDDLPRRPWDFIREWCPPTPIRPPLRPA